MCVCVCVHVCRYESLLRGVSDPVAFFRDSTADAEEEGGGCVSLWQLIAVLHMERREEDEKRSRTRSRL